MIKYIGIIIFSLLPLFLRAQYISSNNESARYLTAYTNGMANDSVFVFCGNVTPTLTARGFGGTAPYTFKWFQYQNTTHQYAAAPFQTNAGVATSTVSGIATGGYKVAITDAGGATIGCDIVWVWKINYPVNAGADLAGCSNFSLTGTYTTPGNRLRYYNPPEDAFLINASTSINVCFTATHTWVSDLAFYLVGPPSCGSPRVLLSPNPGAIGQGSVCNSGDNVNNLCFNTASTNNINVCNPAPATLSGTYGTYGATPTSINWSTIYGCSATGGGWQVQIYDCIGGDVGVLTSSSITFSGSGACGSNSITYSSAAINSTITDNSCTPATASIYTVPPAVVDTTSLFLTDAVTTLWTASQAVTMSNPTGLTTNVNPVPTSNTSFYLTVTGTYSCVFRDTVLFTYTPPTVPVITAAGPFCTIATPVTLSATPTGGIWAGSGITNAVTGQFSPSTLAVGTYTITYIIGGSCGGSSTTSITISATAAPAITAAGPFCNTTAAVTLTGTPSGGTWSGTGITNAATGQFTPASATIGTNTITYTVPGACGGVATRNITVNQTPMPSISAAGPFCSDAASFNLTATPAGGTWSGTGITNATNGTFSPALVTDSTSIIYAFAGTCPNRDTLKIYVTPRATPTITAAGPFCNTDAAVTLVGAPIGGTWSGTGITNTATGQFTPASATIGTNTVTFTVSGFCGASITSNITVNQRPMPLVTAAGPFCSDAASLNLTATPAGGTWSGTGITNATNGTFSAALVTDSTSIIYSFAGACPNSDTIKIYVTPRATPTITTAGPFCETDPVQNLVSAPAGGTWSGTGITNAATGTFDPTIANAGTNTITYTINGFCGAVATTPIIVNQLLTPTITAVGPLCINATTQTLVGTPTGGTWTGNGITNVNTGAYSANQAGVGVDNITYTLSGSCGAPGVAAITVNALPIADAGIGATICSGASTTLNALPNGMSSYSWTPTTNLTPSNGLGQSVTINSLTATTLYHLTITDASGCVGVDSTTVTITPLPVAGFNFNTVCVGVCTQFNNTSTIAAPGTNTYFWDFGDGIGTSVAASPCYIYTNPGTYTVTLVATSNNNCSNIATQTVVVDAYPVASFTKTDVCLNAATIFNNSASATVASTLINWNFGDGQFSTSSNPTHTYAASGTYTAQLTLTSTTGCVDTLTKLVYVYPNPVANFTFVNACEGLPINFNDNSTVTAPSTFTTYTWDFTSNGVVDATGAITTYSGYVGPGTYNVTHTVTTNNLCAGSVIKSIRVYANPIAQFTASTICEGASTNFNNTSSVAVTDTIATYNWNLIYNNQTSTMLQPSIIYPAGDYWVKLLVTTTNGCSNLDSVFVSVKPIPTAKFEAITPTSGCEPWCVTFKDSSDVKSYTNPSAIVSWEWDFVTGTAITKDPTMCFTSDGLYNVSLKVTSSDGCYDSILYTNYVNVHPSPHADFQADPTTTTLLNPQFTFIDLSTGAQSVGWNTGDTNAFTLINPAEYYHHTYADTGAYIVTQAVESEYGCVDTLFTKVYVTPDYMIYIPNAFTLNKDDLNEEFKVYGIGIVDFRMRIFDKWGGKIFESNDLKTGWDGKKGGSIAPSDMYVYTINVFDALKKEHFYTGTIMMLK